MLNKLWKNWMLAYARESHLEGQYELVSCK